MPVPFSPDTNIHSESIDAHVWMKDGPSLSSWHVVSLCDDLEEALTYSFTCIHSNRSQDWRVGTLEQDRGEESVWIWGSQEKCYKRWMRMCWGKGWHPELSYNQSKSMPNHKKDVFVSPLQRFISICELTLKRFASVPTITIYGSSESIHFYQGTSFCPWLCSFILWATSGHVSRSEYKHCIFHETGWAHQHQTL